MTIKTNTAVNRKTVTDNRSNSQMLFNDKLMPEVSLNVYNDKSKNYSVKRKIRKIRKNSNETESSELLNSQVFDELSRRSMPKHKRGQSS